jgi:urease accessory protein
VRATARIVAGHDVATGRTRCTSLVSAPPLTLRATAGGVVHLVGSAAGPVGGDQLHLSVAVGPCGSLTVHTVAASIALPGPTAEPSALDVDAEVGEGARLRWLPEPTIAVRGCDHRASSHLRLAAGARLVWREVVVLGRHDEGGGSLLQRLRVDVDGRPLVRNDLAVGPAWPASQGPAGTGGAKAVGTALVVGPEVARVRPPDTEGVRGAVLPLSDDAALVNVVAASPLAAVTALDLALADALDSGLDTAFESGLDTGLDGAHDARPALPVAAAAQPQ